MNDSSPFEAPLPNAPWLPGQRRLSVRLIRLRFVSQPSTIVNTRWDQARSENREIELTDKQKRAILPLFAHPGSFEAGEILDQVPQVAFSEHGVEADRHTGKAFAAEGDILLVDGHHAVFE